MAIGFGIDDVSEELTRLDEIEMLRYGHVGKSYERCGCKRCLDIEQRQKKHKEWLEEFRKIPSPTLWCRHLAPFWQTITL